MERLSISRLGGNPRPPTAPVQPSTQGWEAVFYNDSEPDFASHLTASEFYAAFCFLPKSVSQLKQATEEVTGQRWSQRQQFAFSWRNEKGEREFVRGACACLQSLTAQQECIFRTALKTKFWPIMRHIKKPLLADGRNFYRSHDQFHGH